MKDLNRVSGNAATTCPFYDEIDVILGTRAASAPAGLLDSSTGADVVVPSEDDMAPGSPEASLEGNPAVVLLLIPLQMIQLIVVQLLPALQAVVLLPLLPPLVVVVVVPQLLLLQLLLAVVVLVVDCLPQEA